MPAGSNSRKCRFLFGKDISVPDLLQDRATPFSSHCSVADKSNMGRGQTHLLSSS